MKMKHNLQLTLAGRIAADLLCRWGMVAAMPDGEDSAGRQRLRLMTPEELVRRAFDAAKMAEDEAFRRGWVFDPIEEFNTENAKT